MSLENARALIQKAGEDSKLRAKLEAAGGEGIVRVATESGLPCALEDIQQIISECRDLSEDETDQIAGGKIAQSDVPDTMLALLSALKAIKT